MISDITRQCFKKKKQKTFSVAGNALIKCGETQKRIGTADRELIQTSALNFLTPLRNFIEGDYKTIAVSWKMFIFLVKQFWYILTGKNL